MVGRRTCDPGVAPGWRPGRWISIGPEILFCYWSAIFYADDVMGVAYLKQVVKVI